METCRLSSGVFVVRHVVDDTQFTTSDGQSFLLRKGDRVALYPPATHKDPEIFENPLVSMLVSMQFKHRFLNDHCNLFASLFLTVTSKGKMSEFEALYLAGKLGIWIKAEARNHCIYAVIYEEFV